MIVVHIRINSWLWKGIGSWIIQQNNGERTRHAQFRYINYSYLALNRLNNLKAGHKTNWTIKDHFNWQKNSGNQHITDPRQPETEQRILHRLGGKEEVS